MNNYPQIVCLRDVVKTSTGPGSKNCALIDVWHLKPVKCHFMSLKMCKYELYDTCWCHNVV